MRNGPENRRKALRIRGYDYSQPGAYYITIVTQGREALFGEVVDDAVQLNEAGRMIDAFWNELSHKFPHVKLGAYVVMPNHLHSILVLDEQETSDTGPPLPSIVRWFKTMTTNGYARLVKNGGAASFERKLWQRSYYEHIVRDEEDWLRIADYIEGNPTGWGQDDENPAKPTGRAGT